MRVVLDEELRDNFGVGGGVALVDGVPCLACNSVNLEWCGEQNAVSVLHNGEACRHGCSEGAMASVVSSGGGGMEH